MAKILIVDDDSVLLKLYSTRLKADNHQVETAINGEDGLIKYKNNKPDLIVLDLLMPKINGFRFIETLHQHPNLNKAIIVVFSSVANQEQINRLNQLGITNYVNKIETSPTQFVEYINKLLSQTNLNNH